MLYINLVLVMYYSEGSEIMQCPKCGTRWKVTNTAHEGHDMQRRWLLKLIDPWMAWYCQDYVARDRRCQKCNFQAVTIEVLIDDFKKMIQLAAHEGVGVTTPHQGKKWRRPP